MPPLSGTVMAVLPPFPLPFPALPAPPLLTRLVLPLTAFVLPLPLPLDLFESEVMVVPPGLRLAALTICGPAEMPDLPPLPDNAEDEPPFPLAALLPAEDEEEAPVLPSALALLALFFAFAARADKDLLEPPPRFTPPSASPTRVDESSSSPSSRLSSLLFDFLDFEPDLPFPLLLEESDDRSKSSPSLLLLLLLSLLFDFFDEDESSSSSPKLRPVSLECSFAFSLAVLLPPFMLCATTAPMPITAAPAAAAPMITPLWESLFFLFFGFFGLPGWACFSNACCLALSFGLCSVPPPPPPFSPSRLSCFSGSNAFIFCPFLIENRTSRG